MQTQSGLAQCVMLLLNDGIQTPHTSITGDEGRLNYVLGIKVNHEINFARY